MERSTPWETGTRCGSGTWWEPRPGVPSTAAPREDSTAQDGDGLLVPAAGRTWPERRNGRRP